MMTFNDRDMETRNDRGFVREPVRRMKAGDWQVELLPRQPYETRYVTAHGSMGFAFETQSGSHAFAGDRLAPFTTRANSLAYVPAGCEVMSRSPMGGEYMIVFGAGFSLPENTDRFNDAISPAAIECAHRLRSCLLSAHADELAAEELVLELAGTARALAAGTSASRAECRWMTPQRLGLVEDYIESHLGGPVSIADLAGELGLSKGFFIRAFKAAMGRSPHGYVIDRRLAHARRQLMAGKDTIAQIALNCGFSSQAHMNALFRQRLGTTPLHLIRQTGN